MNKPLLRLYRDHGWVIWCCMGDAVLGYGYTPKEAYEDWSKRIHKNAVDRGLV